MDSRALALQRRVTTVPTRWNRISVVISSGPNACPDLRLYPIDSLEQQISTNAYGKRRPAFALPC